MVDDSCLGYFFLVGSTAVRSEWVGLSRVGGLWPFFQNLFYRFFFTLQGRGRFVCVEKAQCDM
jgi:hypothetical protein